MNNEKYYSDILEASKTSCSSDSDPAPLKLQNDIFCDYDNTIRARKKTKNSTELHVKLVLKTIDFVRKELLFCL